MVHEGKDNKLGGVVLIRPAVLAWRSRRGSRHLVNTEVGAVAPI